jgi:nicotinate-nucleotide adenylyltransferase
MRIGLFGGSFDPPHSGHLVVAKAALERCHLDRILLVPTGRQPLKPIGATASFTDRLAMTGLLCQGEGADRLLASDRDAPRPDGSPNYTVNLLESLRSSLPGDDVVFAITGADAFLDIRRWHSPERLLYLAEWIVVSRPGADPAGLETLGLSPSERARVHWLGDVAETVSATEVRQRLVAGLDCTGLVPGPVLAYIRQHGLYGSSLT